MPQKLQVKIVTEKEWEDLLSSGKACAHVDEESMGFANPEKGQAYVRQTYWPELNKYLIAHEFEHLLEEEGTDECVHGVRHKKFFKDILAPIALPILGGALLGPVGAGLGGTLGGIAGAGLGAAAGGAGAAAIRGGNVGQSALTSGLLGAGTQALAPGIGQAFSRFGAPTAQAAKQATAPGIGGTQISRLLPGGLPGGGPVSLGASGYNPGAAAGVTRGLAGFGGGSMAPMQGGTRFSALGGGEVGGGGFNPLSQLSSGLTSLSGATGIPKGALGAIGIGGGIAGLGQLLSKRPEVPELGQIPGVQRFGQDVQNRLNPLAQRAAGLSRVSAPDTILGPIRERFRQSRNQLTSQFKLFRPGADLATDTEYARAMAQLDQSEAESLTKANFSFQEQERANIATELGIDVHQLDYMQQLAGLDVETIRLRTGLSAEEANQFKQIFGELGATVAGAGLLGAFGR